jgi:predicted DNA-binding transcriptional regulator AlpA
MTKAAVKLPADRLWTCAEVGYFLGVPVATLYQWKCDGKGPDCRRIGRYLRYRPEDVRSWVDSCAGLGAA